MNDQDLIKSLEWRYATKLFDASKKIDEKTWKALESALIQTPSSFGVMPYKFVVVTSDEIKKQLLPHSWNQSQVTDCSHHVIFLAKEKMDSKYITKYIEEIASTRGQDAATLAGYKKMIDDYLVGSMNAEQSLRWATNQTYIALGGFMTAAALLKVDACPMEGINCVKYDEVLGLVGSGYKTVVACPVGYRSADDKYAGLKKVRFSSSELIINK